MHSSAASLSRAVIVAGLLAGALDIVAAMIVYGVLAGVAPERILQSVASGILGREAYAGGWQTALLGGALHFMIALAAAAVYGIASRRLTVLLELPLLCGPAFGLAMYAVMNFVVVPLSAAAISPPSPSRVASGLVIHMLLFGLPIALVMRRR